MTNQSELAATARAMVAPDKGILAVDESVKTCTKRFVAIGVESTLESRGAYREMMFRTPGIGEYVSGAILFDETIRQAAADGTLLTEVLKAAGVFPGIKVDAGTKPLADSPDETITEGLDGLPARLAEYRGLGARFTKWRATFLITAELPSERCIAANAEALASYASMVQEAGLVPIVEPEVLMDGDHDIQRCEEVTTAVLERVFAELAAKRVLLEGIVLKPNMVIPGTSAPDQSSAAEIAERTVATLRRCVPEAVPGIAFLSGGQTGEQACANLNAMQQGGLPWELTYSFGRALQYPAIEVWAGNSANAAAAQAALRHRLRMSSLARSGRYMDAAEQQPD